MNDIPKTITRHIIELRSVILQSFACILVCMIPTLLFYNHVLSFITKPIAQVLSGSRTMMYTSISEPMTVELRVSFYTALLISVPFIMNRVWSFVKPGLKKKETIAVKRGAITSVILFITGAIFAYYIVVPNVIRILVGMIKSTPNIVFMPKVGENVSFVIIMLLSFGISFQLPIIMILCDKLKIISAKKQRKMWREYITCTVIVAALITPPDAISMLLLACPLIFLYFFTIFYFKIRHTNSPYKTEQKK